MFLLDFRLVMALLLLERDYSAVAEGLSGGYSDDDLESLALWWFLRRRKRRRSKPCRRFGISPFCRESPTRGFYVNILPVLRLDERRFYNYFRMPENKFNELLNLITPHMPAGKPTGRKPIEIEEQLCITLR